MNITHSYARISYKTITLYGQHRRNTFYRVNTKPSTKTKRTGTATSSQVYSQRYISYYPIQLTYHTTKHSIKRTIL